VFRIFDMAGSLCWAPLFSFQLVRRTCPTAPNICSTAPMRRTAGKSAHDAPGVLSLQLVKGLAKSRLKQTYESGRLSFPRHWAHLFIATPIGASEAQSLLTEACCFPPNICSALPHRSCSHHPTGSASAGSDQLSQCPIPGTCLLRGS